MRLEEELFGRAGVMNGKRTRGPWSGMVGLSFALLCVVAAGCTGGGDSETLSSIAGFATLLNYSRSAEKEADEFAQKILNHSKIDTTGLIAFFKRIKKLEDKLIKGKKTKPRSQCSQPIRAPMSELPN